MVSGAYKIRKRMQEQEKEINRLHSELDELTDLRKNIDLEINQAIDADDSARAEKLLARQREIEVKIEVKQRTIDRKSPAVDLDEIVQAANKDTLEYQKKINTAEAALLTAKKAYLSKLLEVASLVNEAWNTRTEYCSLVGGIEDPTTYNAQTRDFQGVCTEYLRWDDQDDELLTAINPEALGILRTATGNHTNLYAGRDFRTRVPDVTVFK